MSVGAPDSECCKVGRGIEKYGRDDLPEELRRRYVDGDDSLRDLERFINESFTAAALEAAGSPTDRDPSSITAVLKGDEDVTPREQARIKSRLEQGGVDVDELQGDYVTFRTVKSHLNDCMDIDTSRTQSITIDSARDTVGWAEARCVGVIDRTVERLANAEKATIGEDFDVTVSTRITCRECGTSLSITEFLEERGCDCEEG